MHGVEELLALRLRVDRISGGERARDTVVHVVVEDRTGTGDHFQVTVVSSDFDGLSLLDQHRRVNDALAAPLGDGSIHELRIKTKGTA